MQRTLRFREAQFSPSEAAALAGLSLTLQRDWRSQGYLRPRVGGRASFSPHELAEMRVMVKLRGLGLSLPDSRRVAAEAAPSVIFVALADHRDKTLTFDGPPERAERYLDVLERETSDEYLCALANLPVRKDLYHYALLQNGGCRLLHTLDDEAIGEDVEAAGLVNLWACARALAEDAPRPLFTLLVPLEASHP